MFCFQVVQMILKISAPSEAILAAPTHSKISNGYIQVRDHARVDRPGLDRKMSASKRLCSIGIINPYYLQVRHPASLEDDRTAMRRTGLAHRIHDSG